MPEPAAAPSPSAPVRERIRDLFVGAPVQNGALTVVPLHEEPIDRPPRPYETLARAVADGVVEVGESGGGSVPVMRVAVRGPKPVLLVEGEILMGGKQNRILNTSVLAASGAVTEIPVSCVEQGRWSRPQSGGVGSHGTPTVRGNKSRSVTKNLKEQKSYASDQGKVWDDVALTLIATGSSSPTASLGAAYETNADRLAEIVGALRPLIEGGPHPQPVGAAAFVNGEIVSIDVFDRAETFAELAPKMFEGLALDALRAGTNEPGIDAGAAREETIAVLDRTSHAALHSEASPGLGVDHRVEDEKVSGFALEHDGRVVHLAVFPG